MSATAWSSRRLAGLPAPLSMSDVVAHLVGEAHRRQGEQVVADAHGDEVLLRPHDEAAERDAAAALRIRALPHDGEQLHFGVFVHLRPRPEKVP
ncbi:MAG TPA: hypothetical protein VGO81_17165 [Solirubrobacteraceae bacterium]|jgi:hypothetical protein|nr:hypothetical protein [Solirubrobacteraceae bacterium]